VGGVSRRPQQPFSLPGSRHGIGGRGRRAGLSALYAGNSPRNGAAESPRRLSGARRLKVASDAVRDGFGRLHGRPAAPIDPAVSASAGSGDPAQSRPVLRLWRDPGGAAAERLYGARAAAGSDDPAVAEKPGFLQPVCTRAGLHIAAFQGRGYDPRRVTASGRCRTSAGSTSYLCRINAPNRGAGSEGGR
jgi:hypothetical protein